MSHKRIAVIRGGPSSEYQVSLETGKNVLSALDRLDYVHKDLVITKKGEWLEGGFVKRPEVALEAIDVVFIALHGEYGEDGQIQKILERLQIPYNGSRPLSSAIAFNKDLAKQTLATYDIKLPRHRRINRRELTTIEAQIPNIFSEIGSELFIKPVAGGSSLGVRHVQQPADLEQTLSELLQEYEQVMVEEFIRGKEAAVGVLDEFRNQSLYVLPAVEVVPPAGAAFFSNEHKYSGEAAEIVPGRFSYAEKSRLAEAAQIVHEAIGCKHYSRSDFIVKDGEVYFLEINTLPDLTKDSLFPKAAQSVGLEFDALVKHMIETASV